MTSVSMGDIRSWAVEKLHTPKDEIKDSLVYETPFFSSWKMGDAKRFSIKRKTLYKNSTPCSTLIRDYVSPIIELHKTKKPNLPWLAKVVSDQTEYKLIVNHMVTSGKFTYGLEGKDLDHSLTYCSRARNPYEAFATGGYSVQTVWRSAPLISYEALFLKEHMLANVTRMSKYLVDRHDIYNVRVEDEINKSKTRKSLKRKEPTDNINRILDSSFIPNKLRYTKVSFDSVKRADGTVPREDCLFSQVTDLLSDISNRQLCLIDIDEENHSDLDDDLYLEDFSDTDALG